MRKRKEKHVEVGYFDVPKQYGTFDKETQEAVCDDIIDALYKGFDAELHPSIDRIIFIREVFQSSLECNVEDENYEIAVVIRDCIKRLDED
jgi:hypothetical protein